MSYLSSFQYFTEAKIELPNRIYNSESIVGIN